MLTTLQGVALAIYTGRNERAIAVGIGFSAGIILLVSFFERVPDAMGKAGIGASSTAFILGMLIVAVLQ